MAKANYLPTLVRAPFPAASANPQIPTCEPAAQAMRRRRVTYPGQMHPGMARPPSGSLAGIL
jgi:hypothetical protein